MNGLENIEDENVEEDVEEDIEKDVEEDVEEDVKEDVEKNQPQPTQQLQLLSEEADLEEDDSDKEKYNKYKKRYLCPLKATTNCSGKEKRYKHKTTLNHHIHKHHPEDYQSLVDIKSIFYTNTRTQAINKSMMMLKKYNHYWNSS